MDFRGSLANTQRSHNSESTQLVSSSGCLQESRQREKKGSTAKKAQIYCDLILVLFLLYKSMEDTQI